MPSFADSAVIFVIALILFGPKKLPQLAKQLGKLMGEFRRASSDFRMQMEDELRISEQEENQKKIDALAPSVPISESDEPPLENPHLLPAPGPGESALTPIARAGSLKMMPPPTGLPEPATNGHYAGGSNIGGELDAFHQTPEHESEAALNGEAASNGEATSNGGVAATPTPQPHEEEVNRG